MSIGHLGVMTPYHPRWAEFAEKLSGPEGCNFREKPLEQRKDALDTLTWDCDSKDVEKPLSRKILLSMGATDREVEQSIGFFTGSGGHCDCEVVFNIHWPHIRHKSIKRRVVRDQRRNPARMRRGRNPR